MITFRASPSDLLNVKNKWLRWSFDNAVFTFGKFVEAELDKYSKVYEKRRKLRELLGIKPEPQPINVNAIMNSPGWKVN